MGRAGQPLHRLTDDAGCAGAGSVKGPFWPQPATLSKTRQPTTRQPKRRATKLVVDLLDMRKILMSTAPAPSALSEIQYQHESSALLLRIETTVDRWLQDDVIDIDAQRTGGLLELAFPDGSKIIINTQPPLHEVWLATRAGGYHYRWAAGSWRDNRDGDEFFAVLSRNASAQAAQKLVFSA